MKNKKSKIITFSILIIAVIFSVIFAVGAADDTSTEYWKSVSMDIANYRKDTGYTAPEYDDSGEWLFAGWFDEAGNAVSKDTTTGSYYAKFVPADILGLKAQINVELTDDDTTNDDTKTYIIDGEEVEKGAGSIRFVTSVDSLDYSKVGFKITRGTGEQEDRANNKVYQQLYATGEAVDGSTKTDEFKPKELFNADASTYFKTWTYTKVPSSAYDMDITVTPYWLTLDGTTVEGTTSIKCVNMGRQWKYIFVDDTGSDETGTGTRACPYGTLNGALAHIKEYGQSTGGEVWVLNSVTAASGTTWDEHGLDVTIKGDTFEDGTTETVDFSANAHYKLGDSVTFENMTLKLSSSNFYANGHRFVVASGVTSDNSGTTIIGGGNGTKVTGDTSVTLLAGSYKAVYGGGLNADVDGSTYVTLQNVDIYDTASNNYRYVCGGGRNGNVTGNTYVTVGEGFNSAHDWENDSYLSAVFGGGYGNTGSIATVEGDTYVVFEGGAKTNYVHGAGTSYSEVKGTSHVTIDGGYAMSVYGGASSKETVNASTSVVMKSGTVEQIFGGSNKINMTGNTDVRILGGTIKRRVYAGCYNDYTLSGWQTTSEVDGYTSVTFGPDTYATLATSYSEGDCAYLASSRYPNTQNEIGVFIVNDYNVTANATNVGLVGHSTDFSSIKKYNYLVKATEGGAVYSVGDSIQVIPDKNMVATVRKGSATGDIVFYTESEGICTLPELASATEKLELYVVFTSDTPSDVNTDNYEAKTNGAYYSTLEDAVSAANVLSQTSDSTDEIEVSILKNTVEVTSVLTVTKGANFTISCAESVTAIVNREDTFAVDNRMLNVEQGATLTLKDIILDGRNSSDIENAVTELSAITESSSSLVNVSGTLIIDGATIQYAKKNGEGAAIYIQDKGAVTMNSGAILNNYATAGSGGAVSVYSGTFTMENGTISNNTASASGGAFMVRDGSSLTINGGTISDNKALVSDKNGGGAIFQHANTIVDINGGTISGNESSYRGGAIYMHGSADSQLTIKDAMISGNSSNKEGGAVYICADSVATLEDGATISGNEATHGGAVCVAGTLDMKGSIISNNTATGNGSGVYVIGTEEKAASFNMSGGTISGHGTETAKKTVVGNAVYVAANASFIMSGTADISSNYSIAQGNGVYVLAGGSFTMNGGTIQDNHTTNTGAGVSAYGSFTMNGGTIKDNTAGVSAGGVIIRSTGSFSMKGGTIENNTASSDGGGIYIQSNKATTMEGGAVQNNNAARGGGIFINSGSTFTMSSDAVITANEATTNGAGVHVTKGTFAMSGGSITNHGTSENPSAVEGAGVYVAAGKFNMSGGTISNNHSTANGAGVAAYATFNMSGTSTIHDNTTTSDGGGVFVAEGVTYTMNNGAEQAIYGNRANNGGGVAVVGTFNFKKGVITNNTATVNGGGTYVDGGTFTMTDTASNARTISANTAKAGAGVYVNDGAFTMSEGTITQNATTSGNTYGAGVYLSAGTFDLSGGSICNHGVGSATEVTTRGAYEGAGICAAGTSVVNMSGGTVSNNYVTGSGAGVAIRDTAKFIMNGGTISDNTAEGAGGAMIVRSTRKETVEEQENLVAAFVMNGGTISGNSALRDDANGGGAIFQSKNTRIEIHDGTISGNRSSYNGGAIFANAGADDDNALFLITGGSITQNTAANYGAGVYVNSGICNMTGGTISEHGDTDTSTSGAINGAGVYVASGGTFNMSGDATITNNYTSGNGAGVYVAGAFNMTGGTISSNKSAKDGAGVYLAENIGMEIDGGTIISNTTSGNGGAVAAVGNNEIKLTSGEISGNTGKTVQGIFLTMVTSGTQVIMNVGFNMGTNDIRFNNVSNTEPILKFVGGTTLSHYTTDNKLQIGLHNGSKTGSALFECESNEAAANIIELLYSNNASATDNNNKWSFTVEEQYIKVAK